MNYFLAYTALFLSTASAFVAVRQSASFSSYTQHNDRKTCIVQQQQFYDENGNPMQFYDENGNPIYPDQQYNQQQQQQQQQYDQQQQNYDQQQQQQQGMDQNSYNTGEESSLLITGNMQEEMARATAGVDVPLEVLALARERAAARVESNNSQGSDDEWFDLAEQKKREFVNPDIDWDNFDPADTELDEANAAAKDSGVSLEEYGEVGGGVMMTEGGLVVDNGDGEDGPQLLI